MKKTEQFNNVSPALLASTKLKKGEIATFKVAKIMRHPAMPNELIVPAAVSVPVIDQIWDEEKQDYVDIAAISRVSKDGNHGFHELWFYGAQAGHWILRGGVAQDQEIFSYLSLSNFNGSNPNRDTSKEVIFELVDDNKKSEVERKVRSLKREALNISADLDAESVKNLIAALGKDDTRKIDVLRNELETLADKDPAAFLELAGNKQAAIKATLNRAVTKGAILFDAEQSRFTWPNGEVILTVARTTGSDSIDELLGYCISNAKGEKVLQTIQQKSKKG
jgi:hypothetical protein